MRGWLRASLAASVLVVGLVAQPVLASGAYRSMSVTEVSETGGLGRVEVQGDIGAVLQRDEGTVAILDTSDPARPKVVGRYDTAQRSLDGDLQFSHDGRWLFYARQTSNFDEEGVHVLDVSDPTAPTLTAYLPAGGSYRIQYIKQGDTEWLVLLDAVDGLVVNRFEPTTGALIPVHIDPLPQLKVGGPASAGLFYVAKDPLLSVPLLYVTTGRTGLQVFDYSDPSAPVELGAWSEVGLAEVEVATTKKTRTVYAATEYWFDKQLPPEIVVLDATKLEGIKERDRLSLNAAPQEGHFVQGMELQGRHLHAATSADGLLKWDTGRGRLLGRHIPGGSRNDAAGQTVAPFAMDVDAVGPFLYLTDASTGILTVLR